LESCAKQDDNGRIQRENGMRNVLLAGRALLAVVVLSACYAGRVAGQGAGGANDAAATIRAIQCGENLDRIGTGIVVYAGEHGGSYPPDLGTVMVAEKLPVDVFVCPAAGGGLPAGVKTMPDKERAAWVNAHTDYVYQGAGWKLGAEPRDKPLAYEKDDDHGGKAINVLFADAHVGFHPLDEVRRAFGAKVGTERTTTRVKPAPGEAPVRPMITLDQAKAILARFDISRLMTALNSFEIGAGRYPTDKEGLAALVKNPGLPADAWTGPYVQALPNDPWGHPYLYKLNPAAPQPEVTSAGPDGKPGTVDDVRRQ